MENIDVTNTLLLFGGLLVLAGVLSSLLATRFGAPLLLVFLGVGMLAGEDGPGGIDFGNYALAYLVGSLALAVILFDGGLRTKVASFRVGLRPALLLATVGVVVTAGITGTVAAYALGLSVPEGLLLGAIVASTDAAAVFSLLRTGGLQLKERVGAALEIESGANDPVAVFLTLTLAASMTAHGAGVGEGGTPAWTALASLAQQAAVGTAAGLAGGLALAATLNRLALPFGLQPLLALTGAVVIFGLAAVLGGSGFLAVYLAGIVMGNRLLRAHAEVMAFHNTATWLFQIVMFLVLGLLATPTRLLASAGPALLVAAVLMLAARPAAVALCLAPFRYSWRETAFVAWVGLRGAVGIFLASVPMLAGLPRAELYFDVAFVVVLVSLLVQGWTIVPVARRLDVALPRRAQETRRVELDLPGQLEYELVGYPVEADSPALHRAALPRWARLMMVVREERILSPASPDALRPGDYAYVLAPPWRAHLLDRLFAAPGEDEAERGFFGEFVFDGGMTLGRLAELYDLPAPAAGRDATLSEHFARTINEHPVVGDRLRLGPSALVVREVEGDRVTRVGLQLEAPEPRPGRLARLGRWLGRLGAPPAA